MNTTTLPFHVVHTFTPATMWRTRTSLSEYSLSIHDPHHQLDMSAIFPPSKTLPEARDYLFAGPSYQITITTITTHIFLERPTRTGLADICPSQRRPPYFASVLEGSQARTGIGRGQSRGVHAANWKTHRCILFCTKDNDGCFHDIVPATQSGES